MEGCCAADSGWNRAEALDCLQVSCQYINPRHTLNLWPHSTSIAAVIQLPGRETCMASEADNNTTRAGKFKPFALVSAVCLSVSLGAGQCAAGGFAVV